MPACKRCKRRRLAQRLLWFVLIIGALVAFLAVGALVSQELPKDVHGFVLASLMVLGVAYLIYMRSREGELFQRWFLPVWLRRFDPKTNTVKVCFRDDATARETASLSVLS